MEQLHNRTIEEIKDELDSKSIEVFESYIEFLLKNDLGFFTSQPALFPDLDTNSWDSPEIIHNAVLEYSGDYDFESVCKQLNNVFKSTSLIAVYHDTLDPDKMENLCKNDPRISRYIIYNAPFSFSNEKCSGLHFTQEDLSDKLQQQYPKDIYHINLTFFKESQLFNPYYNKKVCIANDGSIKNCLMHSKSFGNINTDKLENVVHQKSFTELWHAAPDKIEGIKDSSLRYCQLHTDELVQIENGWRQIQ